MPGLLKIGVFFCFDKTYHLIIYVHFFIPKGSLSEEDLLRLEDNFLAYGRLLKEFDLSPYLYTENLENFDGGIGRFSLIWEKSSVWNEK